MSRQSIRENNFFIAVFVPRRLDCQRFYHEPARLFLIPRPSGILIAAMKGYDAMIVGGGIMGAAAAYELARRGARVALIDQAALPNPRGASVDHSKVFRFAYPEPHYVKMAVAARSLWREMEETTGVKLLTATGLLLFGRGGAGEGAAFEAQTLAALRDANVGVEELTGGELAA